MKALILAAGASTRLYPLTSSIPKCLLPVGDKTILDYQLEALIAAGITEVVLVVGYKKELLIEHLSRKNYALHISYIHNDEYASTGPILGGLVRAREHLQQPIIFFHCDVLFEETALNTLLVHPDDSVMLYRKGRWDMEAGKIIVDVENRVQELGKHIEEKRATGEYLQIAKFGSTFLKRLLVVLDDHTNTKRDGYTIDAFNEVLRDKSVHVTGLPFEGFAMEIDTPEDYLTARTAWVA